MAMRLGLARVRMMPFCSSASRRASNDTVPSFQEPEMVDWGGWLPARPEPELIPKPPLGVETSKLKPTSFSDERLASIKRTSTSTCWLLATLMVEDTALGA